MNHESVEWGLRLVYEQELCEFTRRIVRILVDTPDAVLTYIEEMESSRRLWIRVAPGEVAMVIGRGGKNIQAIRQLTLAYAAKLDLHIKIDVEDRIVRRQPR